MASPRAGTPGSAPILHWRTPVEARKPDTPERSEADVEKDSRLRSRSPEPVKSDVQLLRLECPFCQAEYPLWLREERDIDETLTPSEWEMWLRRECDNCGRTPREHLGH